MRDEELTPDEYTAQQMEPGPEQQEQEEAIAAERPFLCHCGERFGERQALLDHVEEAHPPQIIEQPGVPDEDVLELEEFEGASASMRAAAALEDIARILGRIEQRMERAGWPRRHRPWLGGPG